MFTFAFSYATFIDIRSNKLGQCHNIGQGSFKVRHFKLEVSSRSTLNFWVKGTFPFHYAFRLSVNRKLTLQCTPKGFSSLHLDSYCRLC